MIVTHSKHPFDASYTEELDIPFQEDMSISELLNVIPEMDRSKCVVRVNQFAVPPEKYDKWRISENDSVSVAPTVEASAIAAWITTAIWQTATATATWYSTATYIAIYVAVCYGTGLLIQSLGPKPDSQTDQELERSGAYGFNQRTRQQAGLKLPRVYGETLTPGIMGNSWSEPTDDSEVLKGKIILGRGPHEGIVANSIRINEEDASSYSDVTTYERKGTIDQTAIFTEDKLEYLPAKRLVKNGSPVTFTTPDNHFESLEVTLEYEGWWVYKDGYRYDMPIETKIEISEHGEDSWSTLFTGNLMGSPNGPSYYTFTNDGLYCGGSPVTVTKGKFYDIKVTKISEDKDDPSSRAHATLAIHSAREVIETPFTHPELAILGFSALATEELSGTINITCVSKGRIVQVYNGSSWVLEYSNNPAWIIIDLLTRPVISGDGSGGDPYTIEYYEGINRDKITPYLSNWYALAQFCDESVDDGDGGTENRITFNGVFDRGTPVWEAIKQVCAISRCEVVQRGIYYDVLIDQEWTEAPVQLFSAGNMVPGTYKREYLFTSEKTSELTVTFQDAKRRYAVSPMTYVNGSIDSTKKDNIRGLGITSESQAYRTAYYELAKNEKINSVVTFDVNQDGVNCKRGDVVLVVPPYKSGGRLTGFHTSGNGDDILVTDIDLTDSGADSISVRMYDSVNEEEVVETKTVKSVNGKWVTVDSAFVTNPSAGDVYSFGPTADVMEEFRIIGIEQRTDLSHTIIAMEYSDDIYSGDEGTPVIPIQGFQSPNAGVQPKFTKPITKNDLLRFMAGNVENKEPQMDIPWRANLEYIDNYPSSGYVGWRKKDHADSDGGTEMVINYEGETYLIATGSTDGEFIYWDPSDPLKLKGTDTLSTAISSGRWVMCINDNGTAKPTTAFQTLHGGLIQADTITANYGQIADAAIETAKIKDLAVETVKIKDNAVTIPVSAYTASKQDLSPQNTWVLMQSVNMDVPANTNLFLFFTCTIRNPTATPLDVQEFELRRYDGSNETVIYQDPSSGSYGLYISGYRWTPFSISVLDSPSADNYTYRLYMKATHANMDIYSALLLGLAVKK